MTASIDVKSSSGVYPYTVGTSIFEERLSAYHQDQGFDSCFLLIDENVWQHHREHIIEAFDALNVNYAYEIIASGEQSKSISRWQSLVTFLLSSGVRRNTPLFAIGGGVTGDLAGFVASSTMRGIPLVHIPTTLLAMVDSSIGGKTGVNHETGKNLVGAFYQPNAIIADTEFLKTLPHRDWTNGLSEILKYGAIEDPTIFDRCDIFHSIKQGNNLPDTLNDLILRCAQIKADIVAADEFEAGTRAFLNFGHTFAHALEKVSGYDELNHGEAVYLGMLAAVTLSNEMGATIDDGPLRQFRPLYSFRITGKMISQDQLFEVMKSDKKNIDDTLRFVLLKSWQQPVLMSVKDNQLVEKAWQTVYQELH
jgi:3-dehydroquinate synthase